MAWENIEKGCREMKSTVIPLIGALAISSFLYGCSSNEAKSVNETNQDQNQAAEPEAAAPKAPRTMKETLEQNPGVLVEKQLAGKEHLDNSQYNLLIKESFEPEMKKEVETYIKKYADAAPDDIYDHLVSLLGSGMYKETSQAMESFQAQFQTPELPEGENMVTTEDGKRKKKQNAVILMDASGSMKGMVQGGEKMVLAKGAVNEFAGELSDNAHVALAVYGHTGSNQESDKAESCRAIETVYELSPYDDDVFQTSLLRFEATGWTPLAAGIEHAKNLLGPFQGEEYANTVYIVSDGIETCGGDPVQAAKALKESGIEANVNIIGFDVDDEGQQQLKQVAEAGGGTYATVRSKEELEETILKEWSPSLGALAWIHTEKVNPWDHLAEMKRFDKEYDGFNQASRRERDRISAAVSHLHSEQLIEQETVSQLSDLADEMYEKRSQYASDLREMKFAEMQEEIDQISQQVDEWKGQWEK
jgi:Ca-activated chloride channel family protein